MITGATCFATALGSSGSAPSVIARRMFKSSIAVIAAARYKRLTFVADCHQIVIIWRVTYATCGIYGYEAALRDVTACA